MLKVSPFSYGLVVNMCFDEGSVFEPEELDITPDDVRAKFMAGVNNIAAVSLNIGYPTIASAPHSIANGLRKLIAIAAASEITFKEAETAKAYLADPSAFVVEEVVEEKVEVDQAPVDEDDDDSDSSFGGGMFGSDDGF